jgi:hypothetical protein
MKKLRAPYVLVAAVLGGTGVFAVYLAFIQGRQLTACALALLGSAALLMRFAPPKSSAAAHPRMHSTDDPKDKPLPDQVARTLIEQHGDWAAEIAHEQAYAADLVGSTREAEYWRLIADAIERRHATHVKETGRQVILESVQGIAVVRQNLAKIPQVTRTWFEWNIENGKQLKLLVVEVDFDTDPNNYSGFKRNALAEIERVVREEGTTMVIDKVRIVPQGKAVRPLRRLAALTLGGRHRRVRDGL